MGLSYTETQSALAASPGGEVAAAMSPGDFFRTSTGEVVCILGAWTPDIAGSAEAVAKKYRWAFDRSTHNSMVFVQKKGSVERVSVLECHDWLRVGRSEWAKLVLGGSRVS